MKPDKTFDVDFKMKFYAQYYGQKIIRSTLLEHPDNRSTIDADKFKIPHTILNSRLELKSTDDITNEDKRVLEQSIIGFVESIFEVGNFMYLKCNSSISEDAITIPLNTYHIDYLRSQGYALPFMEYSVFDLTLLDYIYIKE